jgi:hypothetical protein
MVFYLFILFYLVYFIHFILFVLFYFTLFNIIILYNFIDFIFIILFRSCRAISFRLKWYVIITRLKLSVLFEYHMKFLKLASIMLLRTAWTNLLGIWEG